MKKLLIICLLNAWINNAMAAGTKYDLRVDGLACPFCAYGIEKIFIKTEGVKSVDIDLKNGLVIVKTEAGKTFTESELEEIINDTGFSMKSMMEKPL